MGTKLPRKPLHLKMGAKAATRALLRAAPPEIKAALRPGGMRMARHLSGTFDFMVDFVTAAEDLPRSFKMLKPHLAPGGQLWIAWPKAKVSDAGPRMKEVIRVGYDHGLVESQCISLNDDWSALKFTFPKPGKIYRNSYGKLPKP